MKLLLQAVCLLMAPLALSQTPGELLHNGIVLPSDWPPRRGPTQAVQVPRYLVSPPTVIPIDVGRQLFIDDFLIESTTLTRTYHRPVMYAGNPVLQPGGTDPINAIPFSDGVWFDPADKLYKLFYWGGTGNAVCYAYSTDGKNWTKPVIADAAIPGTNVVILTSARDSGTVWMDLEELNPARKFKAFIYTGGGQQSVYFSGDGIHWVLQPRQIYSVSDRTTFFWNPFRRVWVESARSSLPLPAIGSRAGYTSRVRMYAESTDLSIWNPTDPEQSFWAGPDELDPPYSGTTGPFPQLYNLDAVAYESLIVGLFSMYYPAPGPELVELGVGFSRDGYSWSRPTRGSAGQAFIAATNVPGDWNAHNTQSAGGGFLVVGDELWFYFSGRDTRHGIPATRMSTGIATLRRDGFASMSAGASEGVLTTRPVRFRGNRFFVNVNNPAGQLRVEILDSTGAVIAPFTKANSIPIAANSTQREITWSGAVDLSALAGRNVRFRFYLTNGQLFSFWTTPSPAGASMGFVAAGGPQFNAPFDVVGNGAPPASDAQPPFRFLGLPSGSARPGSTSVTLSLNTNEVAACRFSSTPGTPHTSKAGSFQTVNGMVHSAVRGSLTPGQTYTFYVSCLDQRGNSNSDDYPISFSIPVASSGPVLDGLQVSPNNTYGGQATTSNRVSISAAAPAGGVSVTLFSSNPAVVMVPATIPIPAGDFYSPYFDIQTAPVAIPTSVQVSASYGGITITQTLLVTPAPVVSALNVGATTIQGGFPINGNQVTLSNLASGAATVLLSSSHPLVVSVPPSVVVPDGSAQSPAFILTTFPVTVSTVVTITATYNGVSRSVNLTIIPPFALSAISFSPVSVTGGTLVSGAQVSLNGPAQQAISVALATDRPDVVSIPVSVAVARNASTSAGFTIGTSPVVAATTARITATYNGISKSLDLIINPPALSALSLGGSDTYAGNPVSGNQVSLTGPAPGGGFTATLTSSNPLVATVPGTVLIGPGTTAATFAITTLPVTTPTTVTITATLNGVSRTGLITVYPRPALNGVTAGSASVIGGTAVAGNQVSLIPLAALGPATVALSSDKPTVASVPSSISVGTGAGSTTFAVNTQLIATTTTVRISATYDGVTKSFDLVVKPPTALSALTLGTSVSYTGGSITGNQVLLTAVAPAGGTTVTLTSSSPGIASVPANVVVPAGSNSASFTLSTSAATTATPVTITASYDGVSQPRSITLHPAPVLTSLTSSQASVTGGTPVTGNQVTLNGPAAAGPVTIALTSSHPTIAAVPASVIVNQSSSIATFSIVTSSVSAAVNATITATYGGVTRTIGLMVNPAVVVPAITLTVSSTAVNPGGTLTINWTAPAGQSVKDWVALYRTDADDTKFIWWQYTGGTASGSASTTAPLGPGAYEFRYLVDDQFVDIARSAAIMVSGKPGPVISSITAGNITSTSTRITWTTDVASDTQVEYGTSPSYGSASPPDTAMVTSHGVNLTALSPATTYHYRVKSRDTAGTITISEKNTFATTPAASTYTVAATPSPVAPGGLITITWSAPSGRPTRDWVALYSTTAPNSQFLWWSYTGGTTSGSITTSAPGTPGTYEVRYLLNDAFVDGARSAPITVGAVPGPVISSVTASGITLNSANITWTTDVASDTQVEYGPTTSYGITSVLNPAMLTSHSAALASLLPSTTYQYRVKSRNAAGILTTSGNLSFTTLAGPSTYTLTATPATVSPGGNMTVNWTAPAGRPATDWIALYSSGNDNSRFIWWQYTGGAVTGSAIVPAPTTPGSYEFRYLLNGGFADVTARGSVTVAESGGASITGVTANAITSASADIVWTTNLASDGQVEYGTTPSYGSISALNPAMVTSHLVTLTGLTPATTYYFRVRSRTAAGVLATPSGSTFTTTVGSTGTYGVTATPASVSPGGTLTVNWSAPAGRPSNDWIGLFAAGSQNRQYLWFSYTGGTPSGSRTLSAPTTPGSYEFRYLLTDGFTDTARSIPVVVGGSGGGTPAPVISSVNASAITSSAATVAWTTDVTSDTQVEYGPTTAYGASSPLNPSMLTTHVVNLTGLTPSTTYHFRVKSRNTTGVATVSEDFTFMTTPATSSAYTLTATPSAVAAGNAITITWSVPTARSNDWIALYVVGTDNARFAWWGYTGGTVSGSITLAAPGASGTYEFRYLPNGEFTDIARSNPVVVK